MKITDFSKIEKAQKSEKNQENRRKTPIFWGRSIKAIQLGAGNGT